MANCPFSMFLGDEGRDVIHTGWGKKQWLRLWLTCGLSFLGNMRNFELIHTQPHIWMAKITVLFPVLQVCESVSRSVMSDSLQPHGPYVAHQAPLSMGFSRQEHWSGWPFPSPGNRPNPGIKLHCRQILHHLSHQGSPLAKSFLKSSKNASIDNFRF